MALSDPSPAPEQRFEKSAGIWQIIRVHFFLILVTGIFLLPLLWMVLTGLKPRSQTMKSPPEWIPRTPTAILTRHFRIDSNGVRQKILNPKPERIPIEKMRKLKEAEVWIKIGAGHEAHYRETLMGQMQLIKPKDLRPVGGAWGKPVVNGPAHMRVRNAHQKGTFDCEVLAHYPAGLWEIREYVPDLRQATRIGGGAGVTYAKGVVAEEDIHERIQFMWENIPVALNKMKFGRMLLNTLWICILGMIGTTFVSALVAYGFAFGTFKGKKLLFALTLATMMIPFPATMVPLFQLYRDLEWVGTLKPLWVASWFGAAFNIFLLRQFFMGIPKDLLNAARIDGCSELEIFWHVVVPLSKPALAMVALFHFLHAWKDFMGPLLYLTDKSQFTISLGLDAFRSQQGGTPWHLVMAASIVFSLPLVVLFLVTMKSFIRGIAMTGIKG